MYIGETRLKKKQTNKIGGDYMTFEEMVIHNNQLSERLSDNIILAISFLVLGILIGQVILFALVKSRIRIDYDMKDNRFMRLFHGKKKLVVLRPTNLFFLYDAIIVAYFDKGTCNKSIGKQEIKRIRIVRRVILVILITASLGGATQILSAFDTDFNPFNWIRGYRPWK